MTLFNRPPIDPHRIIRTGPRPMLIRDIQVGKQYAWEPDLPYARQIVQVTRLDSTMIYYNRLKPDGSLDEADYCLLAYFVKVVYPMLSVAQAHAHLEEPEWRDYVKSAFQPMRPYIVGEDLSHVSISAEDQAQGSPRLGDMIARNPRNPADQWLVAKAFFEANYTEA